MLLSGSKYGLARCCLYWARADVPDLPRVASDDAARGTDRHAVLEAIGDEPENYDAAHWAHLAPVWGCTAEEWPDVYENIFSWIPRGTTEVALYYDPQTDTTRTEELTGARKYNPRPREIPLTIDLLEEDEGAVIVWDYKTGQQTNLERAQDNGQIAVCCLAAARFSGLNRAIGVLAIVADDGTARIDRADFDSLDLDAIAYEVRGLLERIPGSEPAPGPWCSDKWCPARAVCPATRAAMVATPMEPMSIVVDSADACARIHTQIGLAEEFLEAVKRARNEWLQSNPAGCELADGSVLQWAIEERDTIELNQEAMGLLEQTGLTDAIERKTSKAALERSIKAHAPKGTAAECMRALLTKLEQAGAIKTTQFGRPRARKNSRRAA